MYLWKYNMSEILTARKNGGSLMIILPIRFCRIIGIEDGTKMEFEISKKDEMSLKIVKNRE